MSNDLGQSPPRARRVALVVDATLFLTPRALLAWLKPQDSGWLVTVLGGLILVSAAT
jgi:hypothetical protein